jgi:cytochrome c-type biogenesis protein CcmF
LHTLVIYKSTGRSLKITLIFFILSYILIWYSTFLTRTGVLGETSVHSFTGEGKALYWHLIIAMAIYVVLSLGFIFKSWKKMPRVAGEEELDTREFWILIGAIVLLLASIHIIASTSLPVWSGLYKSLTGIDIAPPIDPVEYYNNIQVWGAIFVALLTGAIQLLKYKKTQMRQAGRALLLIALISLGITIIFVIAQQIAHKQYMVFTFSIFFALLGNIYFLVTHQKLKLLKAGGSITHIGFAIMLLGILLSGYKKRVISLDKSSAMQNWNFGKKTFEENVKESRENILIFRNTKVPMSNYLVTYLGDSLVNNDPPITYYKVRYDRMNPETGDVEESFHLYPEAYVNPKGQDGISANPDAKHYWTHDVFTYITSISKPGTDTSDYRTFKVRVGDSIFIANAYLTFDGLENSTSSIDGEIAVGAKVTAYNAAGKLGEAKPLYIIKESEAIGLEDTLRDIGVNVRFQRILPDENAIELGVKQRAQQDDWIVMKAIIFPYINLLWAGIVIMILGFFISWWARRK